MKEHVRLFSAFASVALCASAGAALVNPDFEDTTAPFPAGWTAASVSQTTGLTSGSTAAALIAVSGSLTQDGNMQAGESALAPFQLNYVMSVGAPGTANRLRLRGDANSGDIITLNLDSTGLRKYGSGAWYTAIPAADFPGGSVSGDTAYHFRVTVEDFDDDSALEYQLGVSSDGVNYTNSIVMGSFHLATSTNTPFETIRFEAGSSASATVDDIAYTAIPEPSTSLMSGFLGLALLVRRRRRAEAGC